MASEIEDSTTRAPLLRRFSLHGDALSRVLGWAVRNVPPPLEPFLLAWYATIFWVLARKQRRAITANLRVLFPGEGHAMSHLRAWRVFWNFACTEAEAVRCLELGAKFDWEVEGREHFEELAAATDGAMILTAHMSNYDVAAYLFAKRLRKPLHMVRAPEATPELQTLKETERERFFQGRLRIHYNTMPEAQLGVALLRAVQGGDVVAIQGDRLIGAAATARADFGGVPVELPGGPFALAAAAKCRVFPLFIVRRGWRRYRIVCKPPLVVERNRTPEPGRHPLEDPMDAWGRVLAEVARKYWYQWFVLEPLFPAGAQMPPLPSALKQKKTKRPLVEMAPSRCRTAMAKWASLLCLWFWLKRERPVPNPDGVEAYYSASTDQFADEAYLIATVLPALFAMMVLGTLQFTGAALVAALLLIPVWLPIVLQILLLGILVLGLGVKSVFKSLPVAEFHWYALHAALGLWAVYGVYRWFEESLFSPDSMFSISHVALLIGAIGVLTCLGQNIGAWLLLKLLKGNIARLEAQLPLNQLPEQFGSEPR